MRAGVQPRPYDKMAMAKRGGVQSRPYAKRETGSWGYSKTVGLGIAPPEGGALFFRLGHDAGTKCRALCPTRRKIRFDVAANQAIRFRKERRQRRRVILTAMSSAMGGAFRRRNPAREETSSAREIFPARVFHHSTR